MGALGMVGAGALSSIAGGTLGNSMSGNSGGTDKLLQQYNNYLNNALNNALSVSSNYTNQAKDQLNTGLSNAANAFNQGVTNASNTMIPYTNAAFGMGQSLLSPYREGGYSANNAYLASLGLPTVNVDAANQQYLGQQANLLKQQLYGNPNQDVTAPTQIGDLNSFQSQITPDQINEYYKQNITPYQNAIGQTWYNYTGVGSPGRSGSAISNTSSSFQSGNPIYDPQIKQLLAQQQYDAANKQYNTDLGKYNQYQQFLQQTGYNPNESAANQSLTNPASSQSALQAFFNNPQYQLLFGNNTNPDPAQRFESDPGTQFAIQQGMKDLQQYGAAKGLLESGPLQQNLVDYARGMEDQNYQRWLNNQNQTFQNYQSNLAGLTNLGSNLTGANTAAQLYSNLGNQIGQMQYGANNNIGGANLSTANDIASLLANQGVLSANAYLSNGAALANGLFQDAGLNAQMNAANSANVATTNAANSMFGSPYMGYQGSAPGTYTGTGGQTGAIPQFIPHIF